MPLTSQVITSHYETYYSHVDLILKKSNRAFRIVDPNSDTTQLLAEHVMMRALLMLPADTMSWIIKEHPADDFHSNESLINGVYDHPDFHGYCNRHTYREE